MEGELGIFQTQLEGKIHAAINPTLVSLNYEVVRIRMGGGIRPVLQIMIDHTDDELVSIDDCEIVSNHVSDILDVASLITQRYTLEISSPGFDRPLTRDKDFSKYVGHSVKILMRLPVNGRKRFEGVIKSVDDSNLMLSSDTSVISLKLSEIYEAYLRPDGVVSKKDDKNQDAKNHKNHKMRNKR